MAKQRADQLLVDRGLAESRTRAQALILAGLAFVGDRKIDKAGQQVADDAEISVKGRDHPWVSRGGIKLDHALNHLASHLGWDRSEEHTSELQSLMRISYAVFCLKKKK